MYRIRNTGKGIFLDSGMLESLDLDGNQGFRLRAAQGFLAVSMSSFIGAP